MDINQAKEFIKTNKRAILLTYRKDGSPQMSPVIIGIDDDGWILMSTRETAYKTQHMRRNPKVSLCVFADSFFGQWIQVDGQAEIISLPEAMEPLVDYYRTVMGEHPDWADYRAAMEKERRVLVRIQIERAGPDRQG